MELINFEHLKLCISNYRLENHLQLIFDSIKPIVFRNISTGTRNVGTVWDSNFAILNNLHSSFCINFQCSKCINSCFKLQWSYAFEFLDLDMDLNEIDFMYLHLSSVHRSSIFFYSKFIDFVQKLDHVLNIIKANLKLWTYLFHK